MGDGRPLRRRHHDAALLPRRLELDQLHHQAARPGRLPGRPGAGADPSEPGERRSYTVVFPILPFSRADRQTASGEWAADMGEGLRGRLQIRQRSRDRANVTRAHRLDAKLASGHALTRPYAVACVTVAKTMRVAEFGRRLDASIRRAGFAPLRLDLAQDAGFAAATLPLGLGLTRKADE